MTTYRLADLPKWAMKVQAVADAVVKEATADIIAGVKPGPSITRSGRREPGTIPVDLGALVNSLQSSLYGSTSITSAGENGWALVAGSMQAGDLARFSWGGPAAPYARQVHDGTAKTPGTHWVDAAANRWPMAVAAAVAKAKAELGA